MHPAPPGSDIRWPDLLAELGKMESRIMSAVREASTAAHSTQDRLDGRLLEHGAQHARDRADHAAAHQAEWDAHQREHEAGRNRTFTTRGLYIAGGALALQFVTTAAAAVTLLVRQLH